MEAVKIGTQKCRPDVKQRIFSKGQLLTGPKRSNKDLLNTVVLYGRVCVASAGELSMPHAIFFIHHKPLSLDCLVNTSMIVATGSGQHTRTRVVYF